MPFQMKIQPLDPEAYGDSGSMKPPLPRSRLKRLFDRKVEKQLAEPTCVAEFEPSSVCLSKMVQNFIELESSDKQSADVKCGRSRFNCFNGNSNGSSDDEFEWFSDLAPANSFADCNDLLKGLIPCTSVCERNLLAYASKIVEKNKGCKQKNKLRAIVTEGLSALNYDASICKSRWEKTSSYPAGEYEYIEVTMEGGERVTIDVDFRSEFEVARPTGGYKSILQSLPSIFVGKPDRLHQIITIASEAATQSLKKKGMHIAPWRKAEYMTAKWLSPYSRSAGTKPQSDPVKVFPEPSCRATTERECSGLELIFGGKTSSPVQNIEKDFPTRAWELPAVRPKRTVTGLAFLLREKL